MTRNQEVERRQIELERKRTTLEAQVVALRAEFAVQEIASMKIIGQEQAEDAQLARERTDMGLSRKADVTTTRKTGDLN
jgi:circadian clock protein KaiC